MKWIEEQHLPLLKRLVMAAILLPPFVALTKYEPENKAVPAHHDTLKVYPAKKEIKSDTGRRDSVESFLNHRCTGVETPGF